MIKISIAKLVESNFHLGHKKNKWNPKMKKFIYSVKDDIHILDAKQSANQIKKALNEIYVALSKNKIILFVCTKLHTKNLVKDFCIKYNFPYVTEKWIGGALTNFDSIKKRVKDYIKLKEQFDNNTIEAQTKKERTVLEKKLKKMEIKFAGLSNLKKLPSIIIVFDAVKDKTAIVEAKKVGIKVIAISDSNADPDNIDICIPGNDDSVDGVRYILSLIESVINMLPKDNNKD